VTSVLRELPPPESPDPQGAFPRLTDEQIAALATVGTRQRVEVGDVLYREGDGSCDFFVIVSGKVEVVEEGEGGAVVVGVHGPGRFLGELGLITGQAAWLSAVVCEQGEVLAVPQDRLREIVTQDQVLGDLILRALILRRTILIGLGLGFRIVGSHHSPDTRRLRIFASRNRLPHHWIDLETDQAAEAVLQRLGVVPEECPIVLLGDGEVLRNPSNSELAQALGLRAPHQLETSFELVVVGAGPSGLAAAVYGSSEGVATAVLEGFATGGQAGTSSSIENYLGFPSGISGGELADRATIQALKFGARITIPAEATRLARCDGSFRIELADGDAVSCLAVVIATGVRYRRLQIPGMSRLAGTSVHYAATQVEAQMCRSEPVVLVGGGNSAGQAAVTLSRYVQRLTLVVREPQLDQHMSRYLADRIGRLPEVSVMTDCEVCELIGEDRLEAVVVEDHRTSERRTVEAHALFSFIGSEPHTAWLANSLALDEGGYILTGAAAADTSADADLDRRATTGSTQMLQASMPGVFAVGDVRSGSIPRVAAAVGDGAIAIREVQQYLAGRREQINLGQTYVSSK
jgi:thioredoxin reductase (NADPH)